MGAGRRSLASPQPASKRNGGGDMEGREVPEGRLLLVSVDPRLIEQVEKALEATGYELFVAQDNLEAILFLDREPCDAVLLEVNEGGAAGFAFCRVVRRSWDVGIMLLLHPAAQEEVILGYQMGADTYLNIPFDERELAARAKALVRRVHLLRAQEEAHPGEVPPTLRGAEASGETR